MALTETAVASRWLRRYKMFFIVGLLILAVQVYLAYKSLMLPLFRVSDAQAGDSALHSVLGGDRVSGIRAGHQHQQDDEDSPSNSNIYVKPNAKNRKPNVSQLVKLNVEELAFSPSCDISGREAISAIHRAKTQACKKHIVDVVCAIQEDTFYARSLPSSCPKGDLIANRALGCYKDEKKYRILSGYYINFKGSNSPTKCIQMCLQSGFMYAGVQYSTECFCGNDKPSTSLKLPDPNCNMKCSGDVKQPCGGYLTINIFETGINKFSAQVAEVLPKTEDKPVRIAFLLTLNGRALRQVHRLLKALYNKQHYFYIHIDSRQEYLYRELLKLESRFVNIRLARTRFSTIWGGASLLQMLLASMRSLLDQNEWQWDFVINLSESDFPVKTTDKLVSFLTANRDRNFVKSHGREVQRFIQKQGLDKTFVECDTHMWRVGERNLPIGIQIDGGSDWVALSRRFVQYVTADESDALLSGLQTIFRHTLLPAESFFHTVLRNSHFCGTYVDNNLHVTNWKRRLGCKCQYKHVVDWCGCSPNDFKPEDWPRLQTTEHKQIFFARKFEPIVNQKVLRQLEEWLFGPYPADTLNVNNYWQNVYHYEDQPNKEVDALLTIAKSVLRQNSKANVMFNYQHGKILEITTHMENDEYRGFLIRHRAHHGQHTITLETLVRPVQLAYVSRASNLGKRVRSIEVSSDFDPKEQMTRNFARALGPLSEVVLIFQVTGTKSPETQYSYNLTVLWIDPTDNLAEISDLHVEDGAAASITSVRASLRHPLTPGIWTAKILRGKVSVGKCKFLVVPLEYLDGVPINEKKAKTINMGARNDFLSIDKELETHFLSADERKALETTAAANAQRVGLDLSAWIDSLVAKFYVVRDTCMPATANMSVPGYYECSETGWSSLAPDSKSDIYAEAVVASLNEVDS